jgi:hypothetical protein
MSYLWGKMRNNGWAYGIRVEISGIFGEKGGGIMFPTFNINPGGYNTSGKWTNLKVSVYGEGEGDCININLTSEDGNAYIHIHSGNHANLEELVDMFKREVAKLPGLKEKEEETDGECTEHGSEGDIVGRS